MASSESQPGLRLSSETPLAFNKSMMPGPQTDFQQKSDVTCPWPPAKARRETTGLEVKVVRGIQAHLVPETFLFVFDDCFLALENSFLSLARNGSSTPENKTGICYTCSVMVLSALEVILPQLPKGGANFFENRTDIRVLCFKSLKNTICNVISQ